MNLLLKLFSIILGFGVGFLLPDVEALITAFWVEPKHYASEMLRGFYRSHQFRSLWHYWQQSRGEFESLVVHSAFFEVIFFFFSLYIASSGGGRFAPALCLGFLGHLFYDQYLDFKKGSLSGWFWALKVPLTKNFYRVYFGVLGIGVVYIASLLV